MSFSMETAAIPGVKILVPRRFRDARGMFAETWSKREFEALGIDALFVQDNHSISRRAGTVRGLHFQRPPCAQVKLVRCGQGALSDIIVDIRKGSPAYGHWIAVELSAENGRQVLVPEGCAHGFVTRKPNTEIIYKCSDFYAPCSEGSLRFDDPDLAIDWHLPASGAILNDKDRRAPFLRDIDSPFIYKG